VIGLTVVALGTSLPELVVNIQAALADSSSLAIGNILGSNLSNILLIIGITSILVPLPIRGNTRTIDIPFMFLIVVIFALLIASPFTWEFTGILNRSGALILLLVFGIFLYYLFFSSAAAEEVHHISTHNYTLWKSVVFIIIGLWWLALWGNLIVNNAKIIASGLGMSERIIGLTVVALGTSLPELATSVVAALKGKTDLAIWNVVWSSIFNIWLILWITGLIHPLRWNHDLSMISSWW